MDCLGNRVLTLSLWSMYIVEFAYMDVASQL